ncbi:sulfotransferase [Roseovarius sp. A21]|uniref:Sulfotransferase n=1 Tax=Roseovarius bejariae TaxID=2576383 RepID=A0A844D0N3_9RHOB|nr:sulfotransferase [Roseovarius bejariae]MRU14718.1 sulfotransferase [Roseovarius bejariae]
MVGQHVILTLGRSGSNALVNLLNQHPEIMNYGEVLGDWNPIRKMQRRLGAFKEDDAAYLDFCLGNPWGHRLAFAGRSAQRRIKRRPRDGKRLSQVRQIGIKDFALHFQNLGIIDYLAQRPDIKVIGLERANLFDRMISNALLEASGVVEIREGQGGPAETKLHMEPQNALNALEVIEGENIILNQMLAGIPQERRMHVRYEDFFAGPQQTAAIMDDLHRFLEVAPFKPEVRMRKIVQGRSIDRLANRDEVIEALKGTRFQRLIDD